MPPEPKSKVVGKRRPPEIPEELLMPSWELEKEIDRLNPWPRPRGFVFKAKTWEGWEAWRAAQENPRLW